MKRLLSYFTGSISTNSKIFELTYLLFRLHLGISIAYGAGFFKMFTKIDENAAFEWSNVYFGTSQWFIDQVADIGFTFPNPSFWAYVAIYGEFIGGILIAVGFLTRLAALQIAFQFFIISFVWYDNPEPVYGMYYQQLFFFCYLLITIAGSGRYGIDSWLRKRNTETQIGDKA